MKSAISAWFTKHLMLIKILGVLAVAGALFGAGWYIHGEVWQQGYDARANEEKAAKQDAADVARKKIVEKGKEYEKEHEKIVEKGDSGHGVGDRVGDALDWLSENRSR